MLAYELDLKIGINVPYTILSAVLAVLFTFVALGSDMLETFKRERKKGKQWHPRQKQTSKRLRLTETDIMNNNDARPLLQRSEEETDCSTPLENSALANLDFHGNHFEDEEDARFVVEGQLESPRLAFYKGPARKSAIFPPEEVLSPAASTQDQEPILPDLAGSSTDLTDSSEHSASRRHSHSLGSSYSSHGLRSIMNIAYHSASPAKNTFFGIAEVLYTGCTSENVTKGFFWSLAITSMHYVGLEALNVPDGHLAFNYGLVILSGMISWCVCVVGCILMPQMESHLAQQFLFSAVATTGVAAMHFTGMRAATFWSKSPPSEERGYPPALATAIVSIAISTCIAANGLLAHAATVSRNKLAEIVWTRRKLWRTIAQKENAEAAAAARSDFIASASHEIRTPLHHLQGYSDLLSQTELTEEGRLLLLDIQRATKTLSLSQSIHMLLYLT